MKRYCRHCKQDIEVKNVYAFGAHTSNCLSNPGRLGKIRKITEGNLSRGGFIRTAPAWSKGLTKETDERIKRSGEAISRALTGVKKSPLTKEHRASVSEGMKKAHAEGRAYNIGYRKHRGMPSYPEEFFMEVICNEFNDKDYEYNKQFYRYKIDFAWEHKKKAIEIDGSQHEQFESIKSRDAKKDSLLRQHGWEVLRIKWLDMFHDTKKWIKIAKDFVD